jgi:translation initiation factor IF-2
VVHELADLLQQPPVQVIKQLMRGGVMAAINQVIDYSAASKVAEAFGFMVAQRAEQAAPTAISREDVLAEEDKSKLVLRPPVVTVLGHVDHGKTTLLDAIRQTNVAAKEAGGITQHIGAYQVEYKDQKITFLDTPGHAAFTAMRARGAQVTDIAVLVVAADDGFMPQTEEALDHAKAAGVPVIVALNKIDKPEADPERVKRQMAEHGIVPEEWGGDTITVPVSAKARTGIDDLLERVLLVAEIGELKANPGRAARGVIIEAQLDKSKGPIAHVLIQNGTLSVGDNVVVGKVWGRVKAMINDKGRRIRAAEPSTPVELLGLTALPEVGDSLVAVEDEKTAKAMVSEQQQSQMAHGLALEDVATRVKSGEIRELPIVLKCDVQGSVEAVRNALSGIKPGEVQLKLVHSGAGTITESDVLLATASKGIIVGFTTRVEPGAQRLADQQGVQIRLYNIIYNLVEEIEQALKGMAAPTVRELVEGRALVKMIFPTGKRGKAAGCQVLDGRIRRGANVRVMRKDKPVFQGSVASLRHFRDEVREVQAGTECGITLDGFSEYEEGDTLVAFQVVRG